MPPFAAFQKSRFSEVSGTLQRCPWGPSEVEMEKNLKICNGLAQTLPMTPLLLHLNGINKNLEIPRPPQNFRKFSEIPGNIESPEDAVAVD